MANVLLSERDRCDFTITTLVSSSFRAEIQIASKKPTTVSCSLSLATFPLWPMLHQQCRCVSMFCMCNKKRSQNENFYTFLTFLIPQFVVLLSIHSSYSHLFSLTFHLPSIFLSLLLVRDFISNASNLFCYHFHYLFFICLVLKWECSVWNFINEHAI